MKIPTSDRRDLLTDLVSQLDQFAIVLCDPAGAFLNWHPGVRSLFGYGADEFIGQTIDILYPKADHSRNTVKQELSAAAARGSSEGFHWMVDKNGQRIFVDSLTIALKSPDGNITGFGKVLGRIPLPTLTEDKERPLVSGLEHSNVMIRSWKGEIEHWTEGCERLYGWTAEEALGQIAHDLLETSFPAPFEEIRDQLQKAGSWQGELKQRRKDGTHVYVAAQWVLLRRGTHESPLVIATHTDLTPRLQMQQELEAANERLKRMAGELERSNEELEEFARIASHDLSAPITSTRWLVDLLSSRHSQQLDGEGKKCLKQIAVSLERMSDLIEAVLTHAKVGTSPIGTAEETDTELALEAAMENLRRDIDSTGAAISYDPLPPVLVGAQPLSQLFQNLLSNAIKYRRAEATPEVKVSADQDGAMCRIAVSDNGMGIESEWFERIFLPMQRLHGSNIAGSGIGLATCRKIVTRAGGEIWVESELGRGSTFYLTLPSSDGHRASASNEVG